MLKLTPPFIGVAPSGELSPVVAGRVPSSTVSGREINVGGVRLPTLFISTTSAGAPLASNVHAGSSREQVTADSPRPRPDLVQEWYNASMSLPVPNAAPDSATVTR